MLGKRVREIFFSRRRGQSKREVSHDRAETFKLVARRIVAVIVKDQRGRILSRQARGKCSSKIQGRDSRVSAAIRRSGMPTLPVELVEREHVLAERKGRAIPTHRPISPSPEEGVRKELRPPVYHTSISKGSSGAVYIRERTGPSPVCAYRCKKAPLSQLFEGSGPSKFRSVGGEVRRQKRFFGPRC